MPALSPDVGPKPLPLLRWVCLATLLVVELLALTVRFDTASLLNTRTWWADLMGEAHVLPRVAIAIAAATFLVGGRRLRGEYEVVARGGRHWPMWPFLLGHLVVLA